MHRGVNSASFVKSESLKCILYAFAVWTIARKVFKDFCFHVLRF